jgi:aminomethyltransferase
MSRPGQPPVTRRTALFDEHVALGADMDAYVWAGMAMPWSYRTSLAEEAQAVRERVGLADVSQLQVVQVTGPGATACLEALVPRRISDMAPGSTRFSVVLSRFGRICDEALIMRLGPNDFWICHGCGGTQRQLAKVAGDARITPLLDKHVLSVQGPRSATLLSTLVDAMPVDLPFMGHAPASIDGRPVVLSRSGFTGELGFEVFCDAGDVVPLWHRMVQAGQPDGLQPYSYQCIDLLRVEAGFSLYPTDLAAAASIWEAGLGWLIRGKETPFTGRDSVMKSKGAATSRVVGVRLAGEVQVRRGDSIRRDDLVVGTVTSSAYSAAEGATLCIGRMRRDCGPASLPVLVDASPADGSSPVQGQVVRLPFRKRRM